MAESGSPMVASATCTPRPPSPEASSSAWLQTPPTVSAVISTRWIPDSAAIHRIHDFGYLHDASDRRVVARVLRKLACPLNRSTAAPGIRRSRERGAPGAVEE